MSLAPLLLIFSLLTGGASALSCYICADENLDEFGECVQLFQYDCNDYARRFSESEKIYCRSTRTKNETSKSYTIMKECISERDHYTKYPNKGYSIDEECDLVDVQGVEMAYCLCRSDYCNKNPIAEQFMDFEKKHPELFGDVEDGGTAAGPPSPPKAPPTFRAGEAPLKIQPLPPGFATHNFPQSPPSSFAAPILNPPAIVPINDLRTQSQSKSSEIIEIRRSQLPSRAAGIETEISNQPQRPISNSRETEVPLMNLPRNTISEGTFVGSGPIVPKPPQLPTKEVSSSTMRCIQCGDGSLSNIQEECKRQVQVECASERSLCFTRQIELGNGMYGMEKMCVLPEQLVNEFGEAARNEGCGSSNGGRVQYCACSSPVCNQIPLVQQRQLLTAIAPVRSQNVPDLAAPELPIPQPPRFVPTAPPPPPTTTTTTSTPHSITTTTQPSRPIIPSVVHRPFVPSLTCISCAQADMADPTADCSAVNEETCDLAAKFCVTKQTQISTSSFAMEKRCLSEKDALVFLPGEKLTEGCATSEGGLVNYCICKGNMCNRPSLLQQAQSTGVRDSLEEQRLLEEEIQKSQRFASVIQTNRVPNQANVGVLPPSSKEKPKLPPVFLDEDDSMEVTKDVRTEEDIIKERQREWARAAETQSSHSLMSFTSSLLFIVILRFF